ncbi:uncharacterized protein LOC135212520 [Macrobrachium nipponense]|uniref:uncharacterized protein LOC135212520 n=1 Tax=Macrobrachium nipponense TaxID=159736 RepID=UPI0030C7CC55
MILLQWTTFFVIITTNVMCQLILESASKNAINLDITKISKIMKRDDPTGKNHSTKVTIAPHPPLYNIVEWKLVFQSHDGDTTTLTKLVDGSKPSTETELIFEGNLPDSKYIFLQALNNVEVAAMVYLGFPIVDLHSNVAWVGDEKSSLLSSVRVAVGNRLNHISVGDLNCSRLESKCYFISPNPKPTFIERCLEASLGSHKTVQLCDERETSFKEMSPTPSLSLLSSRSIEVTVYTDNKNSQIEVVAFDPEDYSHVLSNSNYNCSTAKQQSENENGKHKCLHEFMLTEEKEELMVLVVQIDEYGYVCGSSLQIFRGNLPNSETVGIIVASFIGTTVGVALIILLTMLFVRRKQTKRRKREEREQDSATTEPCLIPKRVTST